MQENKKMFFRELKIECKKAMKNKMFFFTLLITMSLATLSAMYNISTYQEAMQKNLLYGGNPMIEIRSLYKCWMGGGLAVLWFYWIFIFVTVVCSITVWLELLCRK